MSQFPLALSEAAQQIREETRAFDIDKLQAVWDLWTGQCADSWTRMEATIRLFRELVIFLGMRVH